MEGGLYTVQHQPVCFCWFSPVWRKFTAWSPHWKSHQRIRERAWEDSRQSTLGEGGAVQTPHDSLWTDTHSESRHEKAHCCACTLPRVGKSVLTLSQTSFSPSFGIDTVTSTSTSPQPGRAFGIHTQVLTLFPILHSLFLILALAPAPAPHHQAGERTGQQEVYGKGAGLHR